MADPISYLNPSQRRAIGATQDLYEASNRSSNNIATGRRVSRVSDEPVDYFRAKALSDRLSDLGSVKGSISLGQSTIEATNVGLQAVEQFSRQLIGIAESAKTAESAAERQALSDQFNEIRGQIDLLVGDTSYLGVNLLNSNSSNLSTRVGDGDGSRLNARGTDTSVTALGISDANTTYNGFATLSDITNAIGDARRAIDTVRSTQSDYTTDLAVLGVRESYADDLSATLQAGVDDLVNADLTEEAAVQLSVQVRSELSLQSQRILAQGDSLILSLF